MLSINVKSLVCCKTCSKYLRLIGLNVFSVLQFSQGTWMITGGGLYVRAIESRVGAADTVSIVSEFQK